MAPYFVVGEACALGDRLLNEPCFFSLGLEGLDVIGHWGSRSIFPVIEWNILDLLVHTWCVSKYFLSKA